MSKQVATDSAEQDWRLEAELDIGDTRSALRGLLGRLRGPDLVNEIEDAAPRDTVITHDGKLLFAYAADEATLGAARKAVESALRTDGISASIRISHWDQELDEWRQTDPPLSAEERQIDDTAVRQAETVETRTLVATTGKQIRSEFEQTMCNWAAELGVECTLFEHPHLLSTQVGFIVTGPKRKLDEFSQGLKAEERATIRTERTVMLSPL
jgi:hypothetical protein